MKQKKQNDRSFYRLSEICHIYTGHHHVYRSTGFYGDVALGDILMKSLNMKPAHFGLAVSAYAFSAGISGLLTAGFADRYDRKKLLLFFYTGFMAGTILCGIANTYPLLVGPASLPVYLAA